MAKVIINNNEYDIPDGDLLTDACQAAGVPFNCNSGICGSCLVEVIEGEENLSELTDEEKDLDLTRQKRLACVCRILRGTVRLKY